MRLLVTGPRDWHDARTAYWAVRITRDAAIEAGDPVEVVIHGDAPGLDSLVDAAARGLGLDVLPFPARWDRYAIPGRRNPAGAIRNRQMRDEGQPTLGLAFHDDLALSIRQHSGTADMVRVLSAAGVPWLQVRSAADLPDLASRVLQVCREAA